MEEAVKSITTDTRRPAPPLVDASERTRRRRAVAVLGAILLGILIVSMTYRVGHLSAAAEAVTPAIPTRAS